MIKNKHGYRSVEKVKWKKKKWKCSHIAFVTVRYFSPQGTSNGGTLRVYRGVLTVKTWLKSPVQPLPRDYNLSINNGHRHYHVLAAPTAMYPTLTSLYVYVTDAGFHNQRLQLRVQTKVCQILNVLLYYNYNWYVCTLIVDNMFSLYHSR